MSGPLEVPRDRDGSFEPQQVKKRRRGLTGLDDLVISLSARGLTNGEVLRPLAEVSKQTMSTITHRVIEGIGGMAGPSIGRGVPGDLDRRHQCEGRDGNVANRPIYIALAVTVEGTRDILGCGLVSTATGRVRNSGPGSRD